MYVGATNDLGHRAILFCGSKRGRGVVRELNQSVILLHLIGDKAPLTARNGREVATLLLAFGGSANICEVDSSVQDEGVDIVRSALQRTAYCHAGVILIALNWIL